MRRRRFVAALAGLATAVSAGCLDRSGRNGGWLYGRSIFSLPDGATAVPRDDERIADVEPIQTAIDDLARIRVSREEYRELASILDDLPYYEPDEPSDAEPSGYFVEDESVDYWPRLLLVPECGDSPVFDASDDRHSPYGCVTPDA